MKSEQIHNNLFTIVLNNVHRQSGIGALVLRFAELESALMSQLHELHHRFHNFHTRNVGIADKVFRFSGLIFSMITLSLFFTEVMSDAVIYGLTVLDIVAFGTMVRSWSMGSYHNMALNKPISRDQYPEYQSVWKLADFFFLLETEFGIDPYGKVVDAHGPDQIGSSIASTIHSMLVKLKDMEETHSARSQVEYRRYVEEILLFLSTTPFIESWDGSFDPKTFAPIEAVATPIEKIPTGT